MVVIISKVNFQLFTIIGINIYPAAGCTVNTRIKAATIKYTGATTVSATLVVQIAKIKACTA